MRLLLRQEEQRAGDRRFVAQLMLERDDPVFAAFGRRRDARVRAGREAGRAGPCAAPRYAFVYVPTTSFFRIVSSRSSVMTAAQTDGL